MGTSGYQVFDMADFEIPWEHPDLNMVAVFPPGRDTPLSTSTLKVFEIGSMAGKPILSYNEQDKGNPSPFPKPPVPERQTHPLM